MTVVPRDQAATLRYLASERPGASQQALIPLDAAALQTSHCPVIAVTSGKGGVGKTSLVANLALALAQINTRVLALDGDLGLANLDLLFGVQPLQTVLDVLRHGSRVEDVLVAAAVNITLLPAGQGRFDLANLTLEEQVALLRAMDCLADRFDVVLIDTAAGIGVNAVTFAAAAGQVVLVITPEPTAIADAYGLVKVLCSQYGIKSVYLVVNMVRDVQEAERLFQRFAGLLDRFLGVGTHFLGAIIVDSMVGRAIRASTPLLHYAPQAPASQCIVTIADKLFSHARNDCAAHTGGVRLFWRRLLQQSNNGGGHNS